MANRDEPSSASKRNDFMRFSSMAYQMVLAIGLGVWLGRKADSRLEFETPWCTIMGSLMGTAVAFYVVLKEASK